MFSMFGVSSLYFYVKWRKVFIYFFFLKHALGQTKSKTCYVYADPKEIWHYPAISMKQPIEEQQSCFSLCIMWYILHTI